jgi:small subunit ribosomal protein S1
MSHLIGKIQNMQTDDSSKLKLNESQAVNSEEGFLQKGDVIKLKVIEADRSTNRSVLSEKLAFKQIREANKSRIINELNEGESRQGTVSGLSKFGAFVDIGGVDGLVHISELSWSNVKSPSEVVSVGDSIEVYLLNVDKENMRVGLSIKRLLPKPWDTINVKYNVGDLIEVTVTNLVEFGAFAKIEESIEGLIHISELDEKIVKHPKEVVKEGDVLKVKIVSIDIDKERIGLSVKQVDEYFEAESQIDEFG